MPPRLLLTLLLPGVVACDGAFGPETQLRTSIGSIAAPDSVSAGVPFFAAVTVTHGPCQRQLPPRVAYVSDTAVFDARVTRHDRIFNGICDADVLLSEQFEVSIAPRSAGTLVLRARAQTQLVANTVVVAPSRPLREGLTQRGYGSPLCGTEPPRPILPSRNFALSKRFYLAP